MAWSPTLTSGASSGRALEIARRQAEIAGLRFKVRARSQGDLLDHVAQMGKWPTPSTRYCTADHKRQQLLALMTEMADEVRAHRRSPSSEPVRILNCVGLRAEESPGRSKLEPFKAGARGSSSRKQIDMWLPVHGWTESEIWDAVRASGAPVHPAYAAGLPRASCVFCIYAPEAALQIAGKLHPALLVEYVEVERRIGHKFKKSLPIAKVAEDLAAGVEPGTVENWTM